MGRSTILNNHGKYRRKHIKEESYDGAVVMHYQFRSTEEFCNKITRRKYFENRKFTNYTYRTN